MLSPDWRKWLHVSIALTAISWRWIPPVVVVLVVLATILHNRWVLPRYASGLFREGEADRGMRAGIVTYPIGVLVVVLMFFGRLPFAAAAWGILAAGDGLATIVGRAVGGVRWPWNRDKSVVGSVLFVLGGAPFAATLASAVGSGSFFFWLAPCTAAACAAALVESLPISFDDNVTVPVTAAAVLATWPLLDLNAWTSSVTGAARVAPAVVGACVIVAVLAWRSRIVDAGGAAFGATLAAILACFGGVGAALGLATFLVLGVAATRAGWDRKRALGLAQEREGRRGASHAFANVGVGAILAVLASATSRRELFLLALAGSFATAACDTVATEIGQAWGRRPRGILSGRTAAPGTPGAVSLLGTAAGIVAAAAVATVVASTGAVTASWIPVVTLAALAGTLAESVGKSIAPGRRALDHDAWNFANTAFGASCCLAAGARWGG